MKRWMMLAGMVACAKAPVSTAPAPDVVAAVDTPIGPRTSSESLMRAALAKSRLLRSEGGELVWQAMEAHGGLAAWLERGTLAFSLDITQVDVPDVQLWTAVEADLWSRRVRQTELGPDADAVFGVDGERAWISPGPEAFPLIADQIARTGVVLASIPFVFADGEVSLERLPQRRLDATTYEVVQVTRPPLDPISPDHVFTLYLHPVSGHVEALTIQSRGQHVMARVETLKEVDGFVLGTHVHPFNPVTHAEGPILSDVKIGGARLGETWPASHFDALPGAYLYPPVNGVLPASE